MARCLLSARISFYNKNRRRSPFATGHKTVLFYTPYYQYAPCTPCTDMGNESFSIFQRTECAADVHVPMCSAPNGWRDRQKERKKKNVQSKWGNMRAVFIPIQWFKIWLMWRREREAHLFGSISVLDIDSALRIYAVSFRESDGEKNRVKIMKLGI